MSQCRRTRPSTALLALTLSNCLATPAVASGTERTSVVRVLGKADGPPTLFVPGLMSAGKVWEANAERHAAGYRVHVLTLGGVAGTTPVQAEPSWRR